MKRTVPTLESKSERTQVMQGANVSESYSYDAVGNRQSSLATSPWSYNPSLRTPAATFTYDRDGNMLSKTVSAGTSSYTWDFENRLASAIVPSQDNSSTTVSFAYDPFGRRIKKTGLAGAINSGVNGSAVGGIGGTIGTQVTLLSYAGFGLGKSIPVVGTLLNLGLTGWDLWNAYKDYQACMNPQ